MAEPVVAHELEADNREDPEHLACGDLRVGPAGGVQQLRRAIKSSRDSMLLLVEVELDETPRANRHVAHGDAAVLLAVGVNNGTVGDIAAERVPRSVAVLRRDVALGLGVLQLKSGVMVVG